MASLDGLVSETVSADHRAGVNEGAVADPRVLVEYDIGKQDDVPAQATTGQDAYSGMNHAPVADFHVVGDGRARVNGHVGAKLRR